MVSAVPTETMGQVMAERIVGVNDRPERFDALMKRAVEINGHDDELLTLMRQAFNVGAEYGKVRHQIDTDDPSLEWEIEVTLRFRAEASQTNDVERMLRSGGFPVRVYDQEGSDIDAHAHIVLNVDHVRAEVARG